MATKSDNFYFIINRTNTCRPMVLAQKCSGKLHSDFSTKIFERISIKFRSFHVRMAIFDANMFGKWLFSPKNGQFLSEKYRFPNIKIIEKLNENVHSVFNTSKCSKNYNPQQRRSELTWD